jgi:hypothetical protein
MTSKTTTKATGPKTNGKQFRKKSHPRAATLIYGSAIKTYGNPWLISDLRISNRR